MVKDASGVVESASRAGFWLAAGLALGVALGVRFRPVAKTALKAGMVASERIGVLGAEAVEQAQDLLAEARNEREEERIGSPPLGSSERRLRRVVGHGATTR